MSVLYYRLRFDRNPDREPIDNAREFAAWLDRNLSVLQPSFAGYIASDQGERRFERGDPLWQAIVPPPENGISIFTYFANCQWVVDGYSVIMSYKPGPGENEVVFPIWDKPHETL